MPKYMIITKSTIWHAGDQRSKDFPGHGYPEWNETVDKVVMYDSLDKLKTAIKFTKGAYEAYEITPLAVTTTISIDVDRL